MGAFVDLGLAIFPSGRDGAFHGGKTISQSVTRPIRKMSQNGPFRSDRNLAVDVSRTATDPIAELNLKFRSDRPALRGRECGDVAKGEFDKTLPSLSGPVTTDAEGPGCR